MTGTYFIDPEQNCIFMQFTGKVSADDVVRFALNMRQDPDFRPRLNRLVDARGATFNVTSMIIRRMAHRLVEATEPEEGERKAAVVVGSDLVFGLMRIFGAVVSRTETEVQPFRELDDAMTWLGVRVLPDDW